KMGSALSNIRSQREALADVDAAKISADTGLSHSTVQRLHRRFNQLCRRGNETGASSASLSSIHRGEGKLLSRRQMMSDPELSLNPLGARIVCALYPRGSDAMSFPEFCSAIAVFQPAHTPAQREAKVQFVYRMLDIEENEFLSLTELSSLLHMLVGNNLPLEQIQSIASRALSEVDQVKDNRISYQEFRAAMEGLDIEEKMAIHF
ncbi:hypothetical protein BOX15_Mlig021695g1, partial [Macrostomum lignano]